LPAEQLAELCACLDQHRPAQLNELSKATVFEQGLGLFGNPTHAGLLDDVVWIN
jgi:hypothetical protein